MKMDALQQYKQLRERLLAERADLESRLNEINGVLGTASGSPPPTETPEEKAVIPRGRGRGRKVQNSLSMREAVEKALENGPLTRSELVSAVQALGYKFKTKNPANSLGAIIYSKNSGIKRSGGKLYLGKRSAQSASASQNGAFETTPKKKR